MSMFIIYYDQLSNVSSYFYYIFIANTSISSHLQQAN